MRAGDTAIAASTDMQAHIQRLFVLFAVLVDGLAQSLAVEMVQIPMGLQGPAKLLIEGVRMLQSASAKEPAVEHQLDVEG